MSSQRKHCKHRNNEPRTSKTRRSYSRSSSGRSAANTSLKKCTTSMRQLFTTIRPRAKFGASKDAWAMQGWLDNFGSQLPVRGRQVICDEACATVKALWPNTTSVRKPLDLAIMGPYKSKLRAKLTSSDSQGRTTREKRR
ncbi:hypothetical protein PybrP1_006979 [[Pythium] brassicae (nom. inval.)]|nr:hypothetical protein PybrP1_006979 [[Pythium] brassicae (nom. inval.)]